MLQPFPPIVYKWSEAVFENVHLLSSTGSWGAGNLSQVGSTPQISRAYSAIVRSLENLPDEAILWMLIFIHTLWFYFMQMKHKNVSKVGCIIQLIYGYFVSFIDSFLGRNVIIEISQAEETIVIHKVVVNVTEFIGVVRAKESGGNLVNDLIEKKKCITFGVLSQ